MVHIAALRLNALRPDLVRRLNVQQQPAVHRRVVGLILGIGPPITDDIVLVRLFRVQIAVRLAGHLNLAVLDDDRLGRVGLFVFEEYLPAAQVLAIEKRLEVLVAAGMARANQQCGRGDGEEIANWNHGMLPEKRGDKEWLPNWFMNRRSFRKQAARNGLAG